MALLGRSVGGACLVGDARSAVYVGREASAESGSVTGTASNNSAITATAESLRLGLYSPNSGLGPIDLRAVGRCADEADLVKVKF